MKKIIIDAGHGYNTPGKRTPDGEREWTFNDKVARAAIHKLGTYRDVQILRVDDSTGKTDVPLKTRTDRANNWKPNVYIAIHHNALAGVWGNHSGIETYTLNHPQANPKSKEIATIIHPLIVKAMGLYDRGLKTQNLHVLRETHMPAILIEGGFMDSKIDIIAMRNDAKLKAQGEAIAEGLAVYLKLQLKTVVKEENEVSKDRPVSASHAKAWEWAKNKGYLNGERPGEPLTREQFATALQRYDEVHKK